MLNQSWNAKTLRRMAEKAYTNRWYIGKDYFDALFTFIDTLEFANANNVNISTPILFEKFLTDTRKKYDVVESVNEYKEEKDYPVF